MALRLGAAAVRLQAGRRVIELAGGERLRYDDLLIATGSEPVRLPALTRFSNVQALRTFEDAVRLRTALEAGAALTVVGGGLIGLEVASSARRLGAAVTVIEAAPAPLVQLGPEVGDHLASLHREDGVALRLGVPLASARGGTAGIEEGDPSRGVASGGPLAAALGGTADPSRGVASGGLLVEELVLADGSRIATDHVVEAVGVRPATGWLAGSGLDPRGVRTGEGGRTALPDVFAAGDVTGGYLFTHVAAYEGRIAGQNAAGKRQKADYRVVPWVTFLDPEVARVGLTEPQAREEHGHVEVVRFPMSRVDRARMLGEPIGFVTVSYTHLTLPTTPYV